MAPVCYCTSLEGMRINGDVLHLICSFCVGALNDSRQTLVEELQAANRENEELRKLLKQMLVEEHE